MGLLRGHGHDNECVEQEDTVMTTKVSNKRIRRHGPDNECVEQGNVGTQSGQ